MIIGGWASPTIPTNIVEVTNLNDSGPGSFREALESPDALYVVPTVGGEISLKSYINVKSNKVLDGRGVKLRIANHGLKIINCDNVVIHNFQVVNASDDGITIRYSDNIVIDHCDVVSCADGLIDVTKCRANETSKVTISYCSLRDHNKGMVLGLGESSPDDEGIRVTLYRNYFNFVNQRSPRVESAWCHAVNNFVRYGAVGSQSFQKGRLFLDRCWYKPYAGETQAIDYTWEHESGYVNSYKCKTYSNAKMASYKPEACDAAKSPQNLDTWEANDENLRKLKAGVGWRDTPRVVFPSEPPEVPPEVPLTLEERVERLEQAVFS